MWLFYFLFWTAVRASGFTLNFVVTPSQEPLYKKIGDKVVLSPGSVENPITIMRWIHDNNVAMWYRYGDEPFSYRQFKDRGSLDNSTGVMTITGLTRDHSGIYTAEINGKIASKTELRVISPVSEPIISVSCGRTCCVYTCDGSITDAEPVNYWWTAGEKMWNSTKELKITKEEEEWWFSCTLENPVSSISSEKAINLLMISTQTPMAHVTLVVLSSAGCFFLITSIISISCIISLYVRQKKRDDPNQPGDQN